MKIVKNSVILAAMALSVSSNAKLIAPDWLDNVFVTLNPTVKDIKGPVLDVNSSDYRTYADRVIQIALQETHRNAKKYLKTKEYKKYYAMMLMGLTVPMHEGLFTHFRKVSNVNGRCDSGKNAGDSLKDQNKTRKHFRAAFYKRNDAFLANCSKLKRNQKITQMVAGGGDGSDIGIMQLSARWHYEDFLAKEKYKSVRNTLRYGNSFLLRGFQSISRKTSDIYENGKLKSKGNICVLNRDGSINHLKLARSVWGGWYNAGGTNYARACRFSFKSGPKDFKLTNKKDNFIVKGYKNPKTGKPYKLGDKVTYGGKILKQCLDPNRKNAVMKTVRNTTDGCGHINKDAGFNVNLSNMIKVARENKDFGIVLGKDDSGNLMGFWPYISKSSRNAIKDVVNNLYKGSNNSRELNKLLK